jgi:cbb3-type cytochrome oxidase maturation protein
MSVILILIGASILVAGGFLLAFLWSVNNGQYDDDISPAVRILIEPKITDTTSTSTSKKSDPL